ncbi:MAG: choice-of-anchor Q domain-containing protein [Polyangia bacterium]
MSTECNTYHPTTPLCGPAGGCVGGATSNNENIPLTGCGVSDLMVDPTNNDFHPKKGGVRPCTLVDQGTNTGAPATDFDGTARPQPASGTDDIGCYEAK